MKIKYSLILPCFNELENLKLLLPKLIKIIKKKNYEIFLVDDNSHDLTVPKLKKIFKNNRKINYILRKKNRSLGLSIKEGIRRSTGNTIIVMDTDFNHRPQDLKKMMFAFESKNYDMICGSRFLKGGSSNTFFRHICSLVFNFFRHRIDTYVDFYFILFTPFCCFGVKIYSFVLIYFECCSFTII